MERGDDPEARIRDLERPLEFDAPDAYPGPGGAVPRTTPRDTTVPTGAPSAAGLDRRWVSVLQFAGGLVLIAGAAIAYLLFGRSPSVPDPEPPPAGPKPTAAATPTTTAHPRATVVPPPALPTTPARTLTPVAPGETVRVGGIQARQTLACQDGIVEVSGVSNTIVVTGNCRRVSVSGIENVVTVDTSQAITVSGMNNRVVFHTGSPQIDKSGMANTVEQG